MFSNVGFSCQNTQLKCAQPPPFTVVIAPPIARHSTHLRVSHASVTRRAKLRARRSRLSAALVDAQHAEVLLVFAGHVYNACTPAESVGGSSSSKRQRQQQQRQAAAHSWCRARPHPSQNTIALFSSASSSPHTAQASPLSVANMWLGCYVVGGCEGVRVECYDMTLCDGGSLQHVGIIEHRLRVPIKTTSSKHDFGCISSSAQPTSSREA